LEIMLNQFPFHIKGFHSDNGGEYVNRTVAQLLNKLLIRFTRSRPRRPDDYPEVLVIPKNLDIVRIFNKPSSNLRDNIYFKPQSFNIMSSLPFHIGGSPSTSFSFGTAFSRAAFNMDISADA